MARVFAVDVMVCPHCAGRMRLVKLATKREEITTPPRARPVMLGQLELCFRAA